MNRITAGMAIGILIATLNGCEALKELDDAMYELTYGVKPPTAAKKKPEKPMPPECQNLEARTLKLLRMRQKIMDDGSNSLREQMKNLRNELYAQGKTKQETDKAIKSEVNKAFDRYNHEHDEIKAQQSICAQIILQRNVFGR